jgi:hypothetical protein
MKIIIGHLDFEIVSQRVTCRQQFGFTPETCWIAHCKELYNLPLNEAPNLQGGDRLKQCPPEKRTSIKKALEQFGMLEPLR